MSPPISRLKVATRGSKLALIQTSNLVEGLRRVHPHLEIEIVKVTTTGDRDQRPYAQIGGKGLFTSEVERALVEGRADIALHSAKDLTAALAPDCAIVCVPKRASAHDVVVGGRGDTGVERLASLQEGAHVGTSSMRRRSLLAEARPDVVAVEFRGNLDTRLRKVEEGEVDAAILAAAGLERLGVTGDVAAAIDPQWWTPAPAQGALAVEALSDRRDLEELLAPLTDPATATEVALERSFAATLEGGCSVPLGCLARSEDDAVVASGFLGWPDGSQAFRDRISGAAREADALGKELAHAIRAGGGDDLLEDLKAEDVPTVSEP